MLTTCINTKIQRNSLWRVPHTSLLLLTMGFIMRSVSALTVLVASVLPAHGFDAPLIGDDPRAPVEVDEQLICEACLAIVDHTMTELKKRGKVKNMEIAISGILDAACDQKNMKRFKFIPPKMVKGCQSFMDE